MREWWHNSSAMQVHDDVQYPMPGVMPSLRCVGCDAVCIHHAGTVYRAHMSRDMIILNSIDEKKIKYVTIQKNLKYIILNDSLD